MPTQTGTLRRLALRGSSRSSIISSNSSVGTGTGTGASTSTSFGRSRNSDMAGYEPRTTKRKRGPDDEPGRQRGAVPVPLQPVPGM